MEFGRTAATSQHRVRVTELSGANARPHKSAALLVALMLCAAIAAVPRISFAEETQAR